MKDKRVTSARDFGTYRICTNASNNDTSNGSRGLKGYVLEGAYLATLKPKTVNCFSVLLIVLLEE